MNVNSAYTTRTAGPFSAVRPGGTAEVTQELAESSPPEPTDVVFQSSSLFQARSMSIDGMVQQANRSAGAALGAFPQVVHLLADPELHLGQGLAQETGLPLVSLEQTPVQELAALLSQPQFAEGFILEGFPENQADALVLDGLLGATGPNERRVLGFEQEAPEKQEIVDHYVDQGLLWLVPACEQKVGSAQTQKDLMECLAGLPALE